MQGYILYMTGQIILNFTNPKLGSHKVTSPPITHYNVCIKKLTSPNINVITFHYPRAGCYYVMTYKHILVRTILRSNV
jgi:hypothetical protein